jgi:hypothetical protein
MPRFYFDFENGGNTIDDEGAEFPNVEAAKREALTALGDVAREFVRSNDEGRVLVRVRDGEGPVLELMATFEAKPIK